MTLNNNSGLYTRAAAMCMLAIVCIGCLKAQNQQDSISVMRRYIEISNSYKKQPVHLTVKMQNSANVVFSAADTALTQTVFYLYNDGIYIKSGNIEQLANDSVMVFIRDSIKMISVYRMAGKSAASAGKYLGVLIPDSAVKKMAAGYTVKQQPDSAAGVGRILLTSRRLLGAAVLPVQSMQLIYDIRSGLPLKAVQTNRVLLAIDSLAYPSYAQNPVYAGKIITSPVGKHYVLREKTVTYIYSDIAFDNSKPLPLRISDCIKQNAGGPYTAVKSYSQYQIKQGF